MSFALPVATSGEFELTPAGLYVFELRELETGIAGNPEFGGGERVKWIFDIVQVISGDEDSEDFVGKDFWAWTSFTMGRKSNMRAWAEALIGREIVDGEEVTSDMLIGQRMRANVGHYKKQSGDTGAKIVSALPQRKAKAKKSAVPPPTDPQGFEDEGDDGEDF